MNRDCAEGYRLRRQFEKELKQWGWFDAFEKAVEIMPVEPNQVRDFQTQVQHALAELSRARFGYTDHIVHCLKCSRRLITPDAIPAIYERFQNDCNNHQ